MNFYKHHIGDYAKKTGHLSITEHGAYLLMMQAYYATEKPLPFGRDLYRICRANGKKERAAIDKVAAEFWKVTEAGLTNDRADIEMAIDREFIEKQRASGKASALKRWGTEKGNGGYNEPIDPVITKTQPPTPTPTPTPKKNEDLRKEGNAYESETPENAHTNFEAIKASYPRFTGRQNWIEAEHFCHQRIERDGATWPDLIAATQRYATYCQNGGVSGQQFVLTPAKFFSAVDKPWAQAWDPPPTKSDIRLSTNIDAATEFMRRTEQVS